MIIHASPSKEAFKSAAWSVGSGIVQAPSKVSTPETNSICVVVRQIGILRYLPALSGSPDSINHRVWIDPMPLCSGSSLNNHPSLCNARRICHVSQLAVGDRILGIVKKKAGETYMLDIGCSSLASLNILNFEGASKKNRPDIRLKDIIYASVAQADPDLEVELSCMNEMGKADGMGILGRYEPGSVGNAGGMNGGVMIYCSLELVRRLSNQDAFPLLRKLSEKFPFEICVGCNARIWLTARSPRETMLLSSTIAMADYVSPEVCFQLVEELC